MSYPVRGGPPQGPGPAWQQQGYAWPAAQPPQAPPQPRGQLQPSDWRYGAKNGQLPGRAPPPPTVLAAPSPMVYRHVKLRCDEVPRMLAQMEGYVTGRQKRHRNIHILLAIPATFLVILPPLAVFAWIGLAISFFFGKAKIVQLDQKLRFLIDLMAGLADELHPKAPVRFDFDMSAYDAAGKLLRTARSMTGRVKQYFSDKWLRLKVVLADGSEVEIVRQQGIKTKRGSKVAEKRRLFLTVTPNPKRYYPMRDAAMENRLRWALHNAITQGFHNPPELVQVHLKAQGGDISLRIVQEDAEILPAEIGVLLWCVLAHLRERLGHPQAFAPQR